MPPAQRRPSLYSLYLPHEFLDLCEMDGADPDAVLRGFIADLSGLEPWRSQLHDGGYTGHGADAQRLARAYYQQVGYPWWGRFHRET